MKIIDNVLSEQDFNIIKERLLYSPEFLWSWNPNKVQKGDGKETLVSTIYKKHKPVQESTFITLHSLFAKTLDVIGWHRIKINCTWKTTEYIVDGYHHDYGGLSDERIAHMKTAIFYCTTTDAPTVFDVPHQSVDCIENRLVIFEGSRRHSSTTHTEGNQRRIVINFNYF